MEKKARNVWRIRINALPLHRKNTSRSLRLSARTRDFHSLKRSSTLLGTTINYSLSAQGCANKADKYRLREKIIEVLALKPKFKGQHLSVRPHFLIIKSVNLNNGKSQIISKENSSRQEKEPAQQVLCKDNA